MHLTYHLPLVFIFTFLFLVFSVDAAHGSSSGHARRSLAFKRKSHRQLDIPDPLGQILNSVLGSGTSSTPGNCILSTSSPPGSSTTDTPATTSTTPTPPLSSPPSSSPTDSSTTPPQQTTSTPSSPPASSSGTPTPTSTSTPDCPLGVVVDGVCLLPSSLSTSPAPASSSNPPTLSGFSLVSILFKPALNWEFGQLFLWVPELVMNALNLTSDQVKTFALQVYVPAAYQSPADVDLLLTTFLLYIPTDQVPVLANQIKVASSAFYTGLPAPYSSLAKQVDPSFPVDAVQDPNAVPGTTTSALTSNGNKSRTEAIIGVASALGTLALVVLGLLIYRSVKRSRELRHRRLTDPNAPSPYPDRTGRDFDQDSIGGQRRRSFYFAEDSLRGDQVVRRRPFQ
ncbi:hypothetical protein EI94DRAFT_1769720 [Lactarius quietus]|nr:hypothetical protein EI94DRAFT_1769720 [Lactarius quietus]